MSQIDLVVTDLDGTLWDRDLEVHPRTRAALDTLAAEGIAVLAATGRRKLSTLRGFAESGLTFPAVTVNGAFGFVPKSEPQEEREFHRSPFDVEAGLKVLDIYRTFGHVPVAYNVDGTAHLSPRSTTGQQHVESFGDDATHADPEDAMRLGEVVGLSLVGHESNAGLDALGSALLELGVETDPYRESIYGGWSLSAQPPGVTKWVGVESYCDYVDLRQPRILALGEWRQRRGSAPRGRRFAWRPRGRPCGSGCC